MTQIVLIQKHKTKYDLDSSNCGDIIATVWLFRGGRLSVSRRRGGDVESMHLEQRGVHTSELRANLQTYSAAADADEAQYY